MKFSRNIALLCLIVGVLMLVTINANPVVRVKRGYEYPTPENEPEGLFPNEDNEIGGGDGDDGGDGGISSSVFTSLTGGDGSSASANTFEFEKPVYDPKCCASCTCT